MRRRPAPAPDWAADDLDELDDQHGETSRYPVVRSGALERRPTHLPAVVEVEAGIRARRLPLWAGGITAAAGLAAAGAEAAAIGLGMPGVAGTVVASTIGGSAVAVPALRVIFRNRIPELWRRDWTIGTALAAAWADLAVTVGPLNLPMGIALLGGTAWATRHWNTAHEVHLPSPLPERVAIEPPPLPTDEPPEEPTDAASVLARRWAERVAAGPKVVLKSAMLTGREILPNAVRWIITTDGDFTYDEMAAARTKIAARLGIAAVNVVIERIEDDESSARLTIVTRDILSEGITYEGPRYEIDGDFHRIPLAVAADGTGWLNHIAVDDVGVRPALLVGEPGSGKTATLEAIQMGRLSVGVWEALYADGDPGGGSSPLLNEVADNFGAGPQAALKVVEALEDIIEGRSRLKPTLHETADGRLVEIADPATQPANVREMRPTAEYKGYVGVFDEFHRLVNDPWLQEKKFGARCERILRIGRKYGVTLDVATQSLLAGDYGNSTILRGLLAAINAWIHRSGNKSEQHTINGVSLSPGSLPKKPGHVFAAGSGRLCLARVAWSKTMREFAARFPRRPGDWRSGLAIARHRPREVDATEALEDQRRRVAEWEVAMRAGVDPAAIGAPAATPGQPTRIAPSGGGIVVTVPAALTGNVRTLPPRPAELGPVNAEAVFPAAALAKLSVPYRAVLDVLAAVGPGRAVANAEVIEKTGLRDDVVSKAGRRLVELEMAHRDGHGAHRIAASAMTTRSPAVVGS